MSCCLLYASTSDDSDIAAQGVKNSRAGSHRRLEHLALLLDNDENFPGVATLQLPDVEYLTSRELAAVASAFPNVEGLDLQVYTVEPSLEVFDALRALPHLSALRIEVFDPLADSALNSLYAACSRSVASLSLFLHSGCANSSKSPTLHHPMVSVPSRLKHLCAHVSRETDASLIVSAFASCSSLESLCVPRGLTDAAMALVLTAPSPSRVVSAHVGGASITDAGIIALLGHAPNLKNLMISDAPNILGEFADCVRQDVHPTVSTLTLANTCASGSATPQWYLGLGEWSYLRHLHFQQDSVSVSEDAVAWLSDAGSRRFTFSISKSSLKCAM